MSLARYDVSYNLRDRARYLRNLSTDFSSQERLFIPKPVPRLTGLGEKGKEWSLGSVAQVVGRDIAGEIPLPEWGSEIPEPGVRDISEALSETTETAVPVAAPRIVPETSERKKEKKIIRDLDKFYASESESGSDDEDGGEDDEDDEEEEGEEEEDETSSGRERNSETDSEEETDEDSYRPSRSLPEK